MSKFNSELYKCKAVQFSDDKTVLCGFYSEHGNEHFIEAGENSIAINPYTVCRNTGIPQETDFLYEGDLIEYCGGANWEMGFIAWDDWGNTYSIRSSLNYSSKRSIKGNSIKVIGNIILNKKDFDKMQKYSDDQDSKCHYEPTIECRSKQHLNKMSREFLPR